MVPKVHLLGFFSSENSFWTLINSPGSGDNFFDFVDILFDMSTSGKSTPLSSLVTNCMIEILVP